MPLNFIWFESDTNVYYQLIISKDSTFLKNYLNIEIEDTSYIGVIDYNTAYFWKVRSKNSNDSSEWSDTWSFKTILNSDILEINNIVEFAILPNPVKEKLVLSNIIKGSIFNEVFITDLYGNFQDISILNNKEESKFIEIDVSKLITGTYYLIIKNGKDVFKGKFIKI